MSIGGYNKNIMRGGTDGQKIGNVNDGLISTQGSWVDSPNSTDVPLANGAVFYGPWTKRSAPELLMSGYSDQNFTWYAQFATTELSTTPATPVFLTRTPQMQ